MRAKFLIIIAFILSNSWASFSQTMVNGEPYLSQGKIVFDVAYPDAQPSGKAAASIPAGKVVYFKNDKMRIETKMADGHTEIQLIDFTNKIEHSLKEVSEKKYAVKTTPDDVQKECTKIPYVEVRNADEFKSIAGSNCQKNQYMITDKNHDTFTCDIYTNFKVLIINPNWFYPQFREVAHFMYEYSIKQNGVVAKVTAKSVEQFNEDESIFNIPSGYKPVTKVEFAKLKHKSAD